MELGIFGSSRNIDDLKKQVQEANTLGIQHFGHRKSLILMR